MTTAILLCLAWWRGALVVFQQQQQQTFLLHSMSANQLHQDSIASLSSSLVANVTVAQKPQHARSRESILQKLYPLQRARYIQHLAEAPCHHQPPARQQQTINNTTSSSSTMEFIACCGLGHRLMRLSTAALLARVLYVPLWTWWGCCYRQRVFEQLFGSEPLQLWSMNTTNADASLVSPPTTTIDQDSMPPMHWQFRYEIRGPMFGMVRKEDDFLLLAKKQNQKKNKRRNNTTTTRFVACQTLSQAKIDADYALYEQLRQRYTRKEQVDDYVHTHFGKDDNHHANTILSIGVHIRAGNGEQGDFVQKRRGIANKTQFLQELAVHMERLSLQEHAAMRQQHSNSNTQQQQQQQQPPRTVVFVATDMPSYIDDLRKILRLRQRQRRQKQQQPQHYQISVIDLPQVRPPQGSGVLFGTMDKVRHSGAQCLEGWHAVVTDALVLSHADIVLAPRPSALTQSLPLALVLGNPRKRVAKPFCEMSISSTNSTPRSALVCFASVREWACGTTDSKTNFYDVLPEFAKYILPNDNDHNHHG